MADDSRYCIVVKESTRPEERQRRVANASQRRREKSVGAATCLHARSSKTSLAASLPLRSPAPIVRVLRVLFSVLSTASHRSIICHGAQDHVRGPRPSRVCSVRFSIAVHPVHDNDPQRTGKIDHRETDGARRQWRRSFQHPERDRRLIWAYILSGASH
jgi:hypothetical protein